MGWASTCARGVTITYVIAGCLGVFGVILCHSCCLLLCVVVQQLQTEVGQQVPPVSKAVTSFFDPLKSASQTPISETPTGMYIIIIM